MTTTYRLRTYIEGRFQMTQVFKTKQEAWAAAEEFTARNKRSNATCHRLINGVKEPDGQHDFVMLDRLPKV